MISIVTGGAGFIGSHLSDYLNSIGMSVMVIDDFSFGLMKNVSCDFQKNDIRNIISKNIECLDEVEYIFHLAARSDLVPSIDDPKLYFETNVVGTLNMLEIARQCPNLKKFVYAASSSCYGMTSEVPTSEMAAVDLRHPYSFTKWSAEQTVIHYSYVFKVPVVSLRLFNVYGPRVRSGSTYGAMFSTWLSQINHNLPISIVGTGDQRRDFIYVSDVVRAFYLAAQQDCDRQIFNIGSGLPTSVKYIADRFCANKIHIPKRPGEPDITHADISKAKKILGWNPSVSIDDGIKIMLGCIDDYIDSTAWTEQKINEATKNWFKFLK